MKCKLCDKEDDPKNRFAGGFWSLHDYHGISGRFCCECYSKISHDTMGQPRHPEEFEQCKFLLGL